jgi:hypothetical protein
MFPAVVTARALGVLIVLASLPVTARAAESFDGCKGYIDTLPAVISTPGVWCLRKDVGTGIATGTALSIAANNVTLDCNGFRVGGLAGGPDSQAWGIASTALATTIRGCSVRGFAVGIRPGGHGALVEDNRLEGTTAIGIWVGGDAALVRRNRLLDIGGRADPASAIVSEDVDRVELRDNEIDGVASTGASVQGFALVGGVGHLVAGNTLRGLVPGTESPAGGIVLSGATAIVAGNQLESPSSNGAALSCTDTENIVRDNSMLGFASGIAGSGCNDDGGNVHRPLDGG